MIGRTNCGAGGGGKATIEIRSAYNSVVSWTGPETGSVTVPGNTSVVGTVLKKGTYVFTATLMLEDEAVVIYTKTMAVSNGSVVTMYPDGAVYWYGVPVVSLFSKLSNTSGTVTAGVNYIDAELTRAYSGYKLTMTGTTVALASAGKSTMHVIYKDTGSSRNVIRTRFFAQKEAVDTNNVPATDAVYVDGNDTTRTEIQAPLGALAGENLYFGTAYNAYSSYSGGGACKHRIYAVWVE